MAIDLPDYTADELDHRAQSMIRAQQFNAQGVRDADVRPGSDYYIWARLLRSIALMFQSTAQSALRALDPRMAFGSFIRQFADNSAIGTTLKDTAYQAQKATGRAILRASAGWAPPLGVATLAHGDGTTFTTTGTTIAASLGKSFTVGYRSTQRKIYLGQTVATVVADEIYQNTTTLQWIAIREVGLLGATPYRWAQPYAPFDVAPTEGHLFNQGAGGVIDLECTVTGPRGNKATGDQLLLTSPYGTVIEALILYLRDGRDALSPSQVQQAMRNLYGTRMEMLTLEEIRRLAMDTPRNDARECYVLPSYELSSSQGATGAGEYAVYPVGQERGVVSQSDCNDITAHLVAYTTPVESISAQKLSFYVTEYAAAWSATIKVAPTHAPDWVHNAASYPLVATGTHLINRVRFTGALIDEIVVGVRVILSIARGASQDEDPCLIVRKVSAVGADYFDVSENLPYVPTRTTVSQGGAFAYDLVAACDEFFDDQAPHVINYHRHPHPASPTGVGAYGDALTTVPGVLDVYAEELVASAMEEFAIYWPKQLSFRVWA